MSGRRNEAGFSAPVMVMFVAILVLLVGGISVDLWRVVAEHRRITTLVDGAAIAGATAVDEEQLYTEPGLAPQLDEAEAVGRVCDYLARNGVAQTCPGEVEVFRWCQRVLALGKALYRSRR